MATRKQLWHPEEVKSKIQASQLINRLQENALSPVPLMDASQVKSASLLLNKVLPDLKAMELTGTDGGPVEIKQITRKIVDPKQS